MKNIVIGWLFLLAGSALLGVSLWMIRERAPASAAPPSASATPSPDAGPVAEGPTVVPPADMPADMPTEPEPPMDPGVEPATDMPPVPETPMDSGVEPATDMPPDAPINQGAQEVLLVFDARSQHISPALKDELAALARSNPKGSFRIEVAVGDRATPEENEKLGKRRARAIRKVLEDAGIPERKVSYKLVLPGPADGEGEKTSRQWRKATVKSVGTGG
jgi:outer membrane protein OmpA-like peptidoglycan-associated protein